MTENDAKRMMARFFEVLDRVEESDGGRLFHPTTITSCRVMESAELNQILPKLKEWSQEQDL